VGADLERVERRSPYLVEDFFTIDEQKQVGAAPACSRDLLVTAIWSAKEAVLKAHGVGLSVDTRRVSCTLGTPSGQWQGFSLPLGADPLTTNTTGWWQVAGEYVLALAAKTGTASAPLPVQVLCKEALT
jgi:phosphopantetheinyl transferase